MTFQERYRYNSKTDLLGKGGFARVYKATDNLLDREVAIKVFNATDKGQYTVIEEIKKAIRLHHPNLLRYYDVAVLESSNALGETDTLQIGVMELANAGDLKQFAKHNPGSPLLFKLLKQVLDGLEYLHQKGIIHRDMKPQNILLVEEDGVLTAKISDFGISKNMENGTNSSSMAIGTIEYMAPEQFNPAKYGANGKIGTNVDLWSFGIMVHELITDAPLFGQRNGNTTAEQIMNAILSQSLPPDVDTLPEPYRTVVQRCLVSDARKRIQHANELIGLLTQNPPVQEEGTETAFFDKSSMAKPDPEPVKETTVFPRAAENPVAETSGIEVKQSPKNIKSNSGIKYVLAGCIAVALGVGYWWQTKRTAVRPGAEEYQLAMQNQADTSAFTTHLEKSATLGYDSAQWQLASYYMVRKEIRKAAPYIEGLFNKKPQPAFPGLQAMYAEVLLKVSNKNSEAISVLTHCADTLKDPECAYLLGLEYYNQAARTNDYSRSFRYFKQAAEQDNDKAQTMLGNMYVMGQGVTQNNTEAIQYYFKAADKGNTVAMYALGLAYANGTGVEKNTGEAGKWFKQVLDKNDNAEVSAAAKTQLEML